MIIGVINAGNAFFAASILSIPVALSVPAISLHLIRTTAIIKSNKINPGITPAEKVCETGTFVSALNKIAAFEGGIRASNNAADAAKTTTKGFG